MTRYSWSRWLGLRSSFAIAPSRPGNFQPRNRSTSGVASLTNHNSLWNMDISDTTLISRMEAFVIRQMQDHDPSHNPAHVTRVVRLAHRLLASERSRGTKVHYNETIITLAALLHDIGDRKYLPPNSTEDPTTIVRDTLVKSGSDPLLAQKVQTIVSNVSYSTEIKNPGLSERLIHQDGYPELAIVQDADRLDAIGAVGVGRCFTYLGAKGPPLGANGPLHWELDEAIEHFRGKLVNLELKMKTDSGRSMARKRTLRLREFVQWWEDEMKEVQEGIALGTAVPRSR
ncbi:hypothetical protein D8B26_008140 [Coccidioides posadasii str. Silveira]|uniref:HD family hydrolase n=2 Tax=Coccidioides posadasii TaxID=199306 RepID=E9DDU0_COCPS|nr:HD family hydrolase [Coccidioides posadasii str. Silveira]QVM13532.1 hypothetical protein D8B26_008140 [Coccidioides posadasii str. Silveira]